MRFATLLPASLVLAAAALLPAPALAQEAPEPLEIGAVAPDFALPGGTRYGVLEQPVRLSDFQGRAVVLAFFYRARSKG